ncbi:1-acyl-sn-glycerol-3-phosphate acyltransferase [Cupriavidus alkaliphilus]|uniref:1-acyl-sn-glycerol-3-phosphate acyltransferase n=1 Tax=Cupriavidus alkaliphilus TaxID=942866 RepID=A0A7W4VGL0_9BURK|nr:1-acyl-sn-glycerol-3-phosphate acyltransferase [Cupriavidus alkaliphilus]
MTTLPSSSPASPASADASQSTSAAPAVPPRRRALVPRGRFAFVTGILSWTLLIASTLFWCALLFPLALLKLALPFAAARRRIDPLLNGIATAWISGNAGWFAWIQREPWDIRGHQELRYADWYLVNCNHQSWADIFVLQRALNRRIPLLKFFLKQQLIYVPVIGLAWWALDFPFMKRHGKAELRRNPALRRQDQETARRACAKFSLVPTSVMVFAEGTRFTAAKHAAQASPYRHLLKPKAGGLAVALNAMGDKFRSLIDVTIVYPQGAPGFWDLACGRAGPVLVRMRQLPVPPSFCNADYGSDKAFRTEFHHWLARQWEAKDAEIDALTPPRRG